MYKTIISIFFAIDRIRVEGFIEADKEKLVANMIAQTVHQGMNCDGVIAILPVEEFIHINDYMEE